MGISVSKALRARLGGTALFSRRYDWRARRSEVRGADCRGEMRSKKVEVKLKKYKCLVPAASASRCFYLCKLISNLWPRSCQTPLPMRGSRPRLAQIGTPRPEKPRFWPVFRGYLTKNRIKSA